MHQESFPPEPPGKDSHTPEHGPQKNMRVRLLSQRFEQPGSGRPKANWKRQSSVGVGSDYPGI